MMRNVVTFSQQHGTLIYEERVLQLLGSMPDFVSADTP